jgi:hypothetical protein
MFEVLSFNRLILKLIQWTGSFVTSGQIASFIGCPILMASVCNIAHDGVNLRKMDTTPTTFSKRRVTNHKTFSENKHVTKEKGKRKKTWENMEGYKCKRDLGEPTHTLIFCWMPNPLPPRNQCTGWFAPTCKRWAWWGTMGRWWVWS